ncbi:MAG: hypothetical protein HS104_06880 [Polyangiaceae bacterium]|nr:hypothetical protein [Polyangiaceae bacterium]
MRRLRRSSTRKDREIGRLMLAALAPQVSLAALAAACSRLELSAEGRPFSLYGPERSPLPANPAVDERLREADRLIAAARKNAPREPEISHRPVIDVCIAAMLVARTVKKGRWETAFRRRLAESECDLARDMSASAIAQLCAAFEAPRVNWKQAESVLSHLGFRIASQTLQTLYKRAKARLFARELARHKFGT